MRQDVINQEFQERLGLGEAAMSDARDAVVQEIRDAEERLRGAARDLDRPTSYDDIILRAAQRESQQLPEITPSPSVARPSTPVEPVEQQEPEGIEGLIEGGGPLNLPNIVVERPWNIGADESLRLRPVEEFQRELEGLAARSPGGRLQTQIEATRVGEQERQLDEILEGGDPERAGEFLAERQRRFQEEQPDLPAVEPVDVAEALRLSRLAIDEAEPILQLEEADEEEQERLRLVDSQDFLAGFERPQGSPRTPGTPLRPVLTGQAGPILDELLSSPSVARPSTPVTPESDTPPGLGQLAVAGVVERGELTPSTPEEEALLEELRQSDEPRRGQVAEGIVQFGGASQPAPDRVIEDSGIVEQRQQRQLRPLDPDVLFEAVEEAEQVGQVQDNRPQAIRDSVTLYGDSIPELAGNVRTGPQGVRGQRGGLGYRVRNNTDRTLKKIKPGDVVNITGVEAGARGEGRYRFDTETATGTRVSTDQLQPLIDDGSFLFERGHRHELGGHFDENPYGPPPPEPGLLQQGAEAVGGAAAAGLGGAARLAGGVVQGVGEGLVAQLPSAGDVGAALGRGAVAGVTGAGRLAAGAVGAVLGGEEELGQEPEPEL